MDSTRWGMEMNEGFILLAIGIVVLAGHKKISGLFFKKSFPLESNPSKVDRYRRTLPAYAKWFCLIFGFLSIVMGLFELNW